MGNGRLALEWPNGVPNWWEEGGGGCEGWWGGGNRGGDGSLGEYDLLRDRDRDCLGERLLERAP